MSALIASIIGVACLVWFVYSSTIRNADRGNFTAGEVISIFLAAFMGLLAGVGAASVTMLIIGAITIWTNINLKY